MKITISHNGFHGFRSASLLVTGNPGDRVELTPSQVKKLHRAGCGGGECVCGESMLAACELEEPWRGADSRAFLTIPVEGNRLAVEGDYPQR